MKEGEREKQREKERERVLSEEWTAGIRGISDSAELRGEIRIILSVWISSFLSCPSVACDWNEIPQPF